MIVVLMFTLIHIFAIATTTSMDIITVTTVTLTLAKVQHIIKAVFNSITSILPIVQMAMTTRHKAAVTIATAPTIPCLLCMVLFHLLH